ncbi:amino acid ABC transporter substrate-binding protein [Curvibacter sp. CHRR-16]|uniref:amino acid ABC transporter substrate-binding protein n=1 Tax=Curvibacter sp. CHRR-16 TaxID=2835872 RepID=UPI001BDA6D20|nr:amino acid ABC transporter substrate-binding protein [Curvibacter sp. CHRR-16]MBT0571690.1 amino acid ABC transporter substrate-binding protein [Curvibacter sp. CHRR-16]
MLHYKTTMAIAIAALGTLSAQPALAGKTLESIKSKGHISCGVTNGVPGFSAPDSAGKWGGLDVDICRAVAAATLGDADKVKYVPLSSQARFTALQSGEIDILSRNTTVTLSRDASLGLTATAIVYYDGQGFLVSGTSKIKSAKQLKGQTVCVQSGTTNEKNLSDYSRANNLNTKPVVFEKFDAAVDAYFAGRCVAFSTDASGLASIRDKFAKNPADHQILPELISKEPLGPFVRRGDEDWAAIVKWTIYGLLEAEEYGITASNADKLKNESKDPTIGRILGSTEDTGKLLGLDKEWLYRAIKATGNYGEIFDHNVGPNSRLQLPRGLNKLWNQGGLHYAAPIR